MGLFLKQLTDWQERRRRRGAERHERRQREAREFNAWWARLEWELENEINPMPLEEAARRAAALLSDPSKFLAVRTTQVADDRAGPLAPELSGFFHGYERVAQPNGGLTLGRHRMRPSPLPGFIMIGSAGTEHDDLAVRPGEEMVYHVFVWLDHEEVILRSFTTVYHCILFWDRHRSLMPPQDP